MTTPAFLPLHPFTLKPSDQELGIGVSKTRPCHCRTCGGTGWQWLMKSAFRSDGFRRNRCGICGGTGLSEYRDSPAFVRFQADARATITKASAS